MRRARWYDQLYNHPKTGPLLHVVELALSPLSRCDLAELCERLEQLLGLRKPKRGGAWENPLGEYLVPDTISTLYLPPANASSARIIEEELAADLVDEDGDTLLRDSLFSDARSQRTEHEAPDFFGVPSAVSADCDRVEDLGGPAPRGGGSGSLRGSPKSSSQKSSSRRGSPRGSPSLMSPQGVELSREYSFGQDNGGQGPGGGGAGPGLGSPSLVGRISPGDGVRVE